MFDKSPQALAFFDRHLWQRLGYSSYAENPAQMQVKSRKRLKKDDHSTTPVGLNRGSKATQGMILAATRGSAFIAGSDIYVPDAGLKAHAFIVPPGDASEKRRKRAFARWLLDTEPAEAVMLTTIDSDKRPDDFMRLSYPRQAVLVTPSETLAFDWVGFQQAARLVMERDLEWEDCTAIQVDRERRDMDKVRRKVKESPALKAALSLPHYTTGTATMLAWLFWQPKSKKDSKKDSKQ